ncbi:hypothetical protein HK405_014533, partial [Cladochytrium tenue]
VLAGVRDWRLHRLVAVCDRRRRLRELQDEPPRRIAERRGAYRRRARHLPVPCLDAFPQPYRAPDRPPLCRADQVVGIRALQHAGAARPDGPGPRHHPAAADPLRLADRACHRGRFRLCMASVSSRCHRARTHPPPHPPRRRRTAPKREGGL